MPSVQDQLAKLSEEFRTFRDDRHKSYKDLDEAQTTTDTECGILIPPIRQIYTAELKFRTPRSIKIS